MTRASLALLLTLGCEQTSATLGRGGAYFQDARTGLCFVYWRTWSKGGERETVASVPCTDKVMNMVRETNQKGD